MSSTDAWRSLSKDYEAARGRYDSLDRLLEWAAQRGLMGIIEGKDILDVGCGNGEKAIELTRGGARSVLGLDIAANFLTPPGGLDVTVPWLRRKPGGDAACHPIVTSRRRGAHHFAGALPHSLRHRTSRATDARHRHLLVDGHSLVAAGFWIEEIAEPQLTAEQKEKFPEKPAWLAR